MKIAIFHELHSGGARRSVNEFSKRLKRKHKVDLYIVDEKVNNSEKHFFSSVNFYKFTSKKWTGHDWKVRLYKDTLELYNLYKLHKKIAKEINEKDYDLIFLDPSKYTQAPFILRFLKKKKIYYCQEPLRLVYEEVLKVNENLPKHKYYYERLNRYIRKKIDLKNIAYSDKLIANSNYSRKNILKCYGLNSTVSYMGVDEKVFRPEKVKKDIDVLFIGSYDPVSGYGLFVNTQKYLKKDLNIKILAAEKQWITDDKMLRNLYRRSKIILALADNEPFGLIPIEAMSCGSPVVAINEGGYKETVIDGKTGYLVEKDPKKLAEKLNSLVSSPKKITKMGEAGREQILNNWTWDKQTEKLENLFKKFLEK